MQLDLEGLTEAIPGAIFAAGLARALGQLCRDAEHQHTAEKMLLGLWRTIRPELTAAVLRHPTGKLAAAAVLLEEYFLHRGDWRVIESTLFGASCNHSGDPIAAARLIEIVSDAVTVVAHEYTKDHG